MVHRGRIQLLRYTPRNMELEQIGHYGRGDFIAKKINEFKVSSKPVGETISLKETFCQPQNLPSFARSLGTCLPPNCKWQWEFHWIECHKYDVFMDPWEINFWRKKRMFWNNFQTHKSLKNIQKHPHAVVKLAVKMDHFFKDETCQRSV